MTNETLELITKYPWLKDEATEEYGLTWLDELEPGWKKAFGKELCEELAEALKLDNCEDKFQFLQIKEKYGSLRLYAVGYDEHTQNVLSKYEELSRYICGQCGERATHISRGWIYPLCTECSKDTGVSAITIEEAYKMTTEEITKEINNIKTNYHYQDYWRRF